MSVASQGCADHGRDQRLLASFRLTLTDIEPLPGEFLDVIAVRELADNRVLVADADARSITFLDPASGHAITLGAHGDGPGEYRSVSGLFQLRGDSTMLFDGTASRILLLAGTSFTGVTSSMSGALIGADTLMNLLAAAYLPSRTSVDSVAIMRIERGSRAVDTVAKLVEAERLTISVGNVPQLVANVLIPSEPALLFPDGWIAIVYADPYHVDWIDTAGARVTGPPIPYGHVRFDEGQRMAVLRQFGMGEQYLRYLDAPRYLPPFLNRRRVPPYGIVVGAPDGRLLVRRAMPVGSSRVTYDVIDRDGRLSGILDLDSNHRVVGPGRRAIYFTTTDAVGFQQLWKARWPN